MKVLGLVASPRKIGNSEIIVKEIVSSLPAEWDKEMIRMTDLNIGLCKACYACLPRDKRCVLDDDLNYFLDRVKAADKVVIAAPVYYLGQHTSLKLVNDRLISIQNNTAEYATGKQCVIAVPHTVPGWEGYGREAAMHFARFLGLDVTGTVILRSILPGDVLREDLLLKIRALAQSLVNNARVDFIDEDKAYCPECGSSLLQIFHNGQWRCVMCSSKGQLKSENGEFRLALIPARPSRFSAEGLAEHGCTLTNIKEEYIRRKDEVREAQQKYR
ncbi:MAG: NAD(P)H-dependent oxidoreductase [Gracilibacteraceae bacterium]|jgi:multimeric flavodoxin WrbA/ribosomal protein S27AE|nr:NAD(P)H-dependent oxidoreductase [Gracilibacteraceae bacterium]